MNGLNKYLNHVILREGIAPEFELEVKAKTGERFLIPIGVVIEFLSSLKKELRLVVLKKIVCAERKNLDMIPVFQQLAIPMVNRRI